MPLSATIDRRRKMMEKKEQAVNTVSSLFFAVWESYENEQSENHFGWKSKRNLHIRTCRVHASQDNWLRFTATHALLRHVIYSRSDGATSLRESLLSWIQEAVTYTDEVLFPRKSCGGYWKIVASNSFSFSSDRTTGFKQFLLLTWQLRNISFESVEFLKDYGKT